jgi:hypothetical protein
MLSLRLQKSAEMTGSFILVRQSIPKFHHAYANVFTDDADEPAEPRLNTVQVNYFGVLYTTKLTLHYFNKQDEYRDRYLIFEGSLALTSTCLVERSIKAPSLVSEASYAVSGNLVCSE